jgi:hypothetical protein
VLLGFAVPLTTLSILCKKMLGQNHFVEPNRHASTFVHLIFSITGPHAEHRWSCSLALTLEEPGTSYYARRRSRLNVNLVQFKSQFFCSEDFALWADYFREEILFV